MRIAIIGSGISGLVAAHKLSDAHEVVVFEANRYVGGHTNTVDVELDGESHAIDTGFIVFNDRTYPNFCQLLDELQVKSTPTAMSFSVRSDRENLEYNGSSLNGLFCQRRNLVRPSFYRMVRDIIRFNRESPKILEGADGAMTVAQYLKSYGYSRQFADHYLLPMGAAIWSCPTATFEDFPIQFIVAFYRNHGLLSLSDRPTWRVIKGGSRQYVDAITRRFRGEIRLQNPVMNVTRANECVKVTTQSQTEEFDEVVFACHSDQALSILGGNATTTEEVVLGAIPYELNTAVLHTDESVLPQCKEAWASWNYHVPVGPASKSTLTYNMNILQHIKSKHTFCVTLNEEPSLNPDKVLRTFRYSHPIFTIEREDAQRRHEELIRQNRTSFCGAYWGNGFHEDGVNSGLKVAQAFQREREQTSVEGMCRA